MKILWIYFGGLHKLDYIKGSFLFILGSYGQGTEWGIFFGVAKISNIFRVLEIPDIFLG